MVDQGTPYYLVQPLQHLHKLVMEQDGMFKDAHNIPRYPNKIILAIHNHINTNISNNASAPNINVLPGNTVIQSQ